MKNIYIFNMTSRSICYGIGTYIRQLIRTAQYAGLRVHYVLISDQFNEFNVVDSKRIRLLQVPLPTHYMNFANGLAKIERSIAYLLKEYIVDDEDNIFHFNILRQNTLISRMREFYKGKFVLTVHYTEWSLELLGNRRKLQQLLRKLEKTDKLTP